MSTRRTLIASAVGLTLLAAGGGFAFAQMKPGHENHGRGMMHHAMEHPRGERADFRPGRHIEGRIAFLKAELKITEAQTPAFNALAQAMRSNAETASANMQKMREQRGPDKPKPGTIERLEMRAAMTRQMAEQSQRMLDATKPLYAQLSDAQKKTADELLNARMRGPRGPHKPMRG